MSFGAGGTTVRTITVGADDSALKNLIAVANSADAALGNIGQTVKGLAGSASNLTAITAALRANTDAQKAQSTEALNAAKIQTEAAKAAAMVTKAQSAEAAAAAKIAATAQKMQASEALAAAKLAGMASKTQGAEAAAAAKVSGIAAKTAAVEALTAAKIQVEAAKATAIAQKTAAGEAKEAARVEKERAKAAKEAAAAEAAAAAATANKTSVLAGVTAGLKGAAGGAAGYAKALVDIGQQAYAAAQQLVAFAAEGAKIQQLGTAFTALGGSSQELGRLKELTGGLVSDADLMKASNLAKLFNLPAEEIPKLIKLAQGASVALGSTVGKALEDTFTAASRQSKMIADNMGIVMGDMEAKQAAYAKKIGVSVESLTDKQKQLVFVQTMIAEGGRQVELAALSQNNQFAKGEVALENLTNRMKVLAAESFVSSGAMDALMGVFGQVEAMVTDNAGALAGSLMPAFKALLGVVPPVLQVVGALLPILDLLPPVLTVVSALITGLAPIVGVVAVAFKGLASVAIDLVQIALWPLIGALEVTVGLVDEDLARGFTKAREQIEGLTHAANDDRDALYKVGDSGRSAAMGLDGAGLSAAQTTEILKFLKAQADETAAAALRFYKVMSGQDVKASVDNVKKLEEAFKKITSEELTKRLDKLKEAKFIIKTDEDAIKSLADRISTEFAVANGLVGSEARSMYEHSERLIRDSLGDAAKAAVEAQMQAYQAVASVQKMEEDRVRFGVSVLGELAMQGVKDKVAAMKKLEEEHDRIAAAISSSAIMSEGQKEGEMSRLANEYNEAAISIENAFKDKGKGGRGIDKEKMESQARLLLMEDESRRIYEIQMKYGEMGMFNAVSGDLQEALLKKQSAEVERVEAEMALAKQERAQKQIDEARQLTQFLADENERRYLQAIETANKQAREMSRIAAFNPTALAGVEMQRQAMVGQAAQAALMEGPLGGLLNIGSAIGDNLAAGVDVGMAALDALGEKSKANTELLAGLFQGMGTSVVDTFMQIGVAGADMRESTFKMMGGLFGQLSTAFLAWATAEGNLLAGNPFGAAAAAITLGVVASAISAFGSRGKGGGGGGAGSGAGAGLGAARAMERRRDEEGKSKAADVYNIYGFATLDQVNRATDRSSKRGQDLRGRERAA